MSKAAVEELERIVAVVTSSDFMQALAVVGRATCGMIATLDRIAPRWREIAERLGEDGGSGA